MTANANRGAAAAWPLDWSGARDAAQPQAYSIKRHGVSLTNCDDEPVHTPGCIQAHGLLLALRPLDLVVTQVSDNCLRWCGLSVDQVLGQPLALVVGAQAAQRVRQLTTSSVALEHNPSLVLSARLPHAPADAAAMDMTLHSADGVLLLEMEPGGRDAAVVVHEGDYFSMVRRTLGALKATRSLAEFCEVLALEARAITGLDRAMVYHFHRDASGEVLADARRDDLPSWLGLRYPAADIPRPAREIFKRIGVRPLPDAQGELCEMVPLLNPDTGRALDMTHCALRGASVMYTEYLHNMGVAATLTMPIMRDGELWGLIACHHHSATVMPHALRSAAEFLAQLASLEIAQAEAREHQLYRERLDVVNLAMLARAAVDGKLSLASSASHGLLEGIQADGVAIFQRGRWLTAGLTPEPGALDPLAVWLRARIDQAPDAQQVYATDALGDAWAPGRAFAAQASGVLATAVSRRGNSALVLWFRQEQLQTYSWAGNPHEKPAALGPMGLRLTPRRSFELWQEQVRGRSRPWLDVEIEAAQGLRRMVMELVVMRAEQLAEINAELASSNAELDAFAYLAGHDLKEPLRGIRSSALQLLDDAKAGRGHDAASLDWLLRTTGRMDTLLDALLHYSRLGRLSSDFTWIDLGPVLVEATDMLGARLAESQVELRLPRPLPTACCDRVRVREVYANLIANAIKYNDKPQRWVEIGYIDVFEPPGEPPGEATSELASVVARPASTPPHCQADTIFYVRDNGIGIDARHKDRVFALFKRLHGQDEFGGGSGAGLTIARKMVEQHRGCIWFDSQPGVGSTFYFTLPGDGVNCGASLADLDVA